MTTYEGVLERIGRQYLPTKRWGAVEAKILGQVPSLAAPIIPAEELMDETIASGLIGLSTAISNLSHQLDLDRPLHWCVTGSDTLNAMMAGYQDPPMYCVAIGKGLIDASFQFCAAISRSAPILEFLANGVDSVDDMKPLERSRRDAWITLLQGTDVLPPRIEPVATLTFIAMHFLMAHEIAHLAGGHLPLFVGGFTAETQLAAEEGSAVSRVLERDADTLAATATIYLLGRSDARDFWSDSLADVDSALRHLLTALYILFSVMDLAGPEDPFAVERSHPPALVRINIIAQMLSLALDDWGVMDKDSVWEAARRSTRAVEIAVMDLGGGMMTPEEVALLEADVERNFDQHRELWPTVKARLDRGHLDRYWWSRGLR